MAQVATGQGPVEARSLSSITAIASNPPAYPRNPTQQPLDPLVLYIVRVPGSRDVVLTPLKPPTKSSVSAEAINASLYYLHVASAEDEAVLRAIELERDREQQEAASHGGQSRTGLSAATLARLNSFRRKPVGGRTEPTPPPPPPPPPPHQESVENARPPVSDPIQRQPVSRPRPNEASDYRPEAENAQIEGSIGKQVPGDRPVSSITEANDNTKKFNIPRRPLTSLPKQNDSSLRFAGGDVSYQTRWSADLGHSPTWPPMDSHDTDSRFRSSLDAPRPQVVPKLSPSDSSFREPGVPATDSHRRNMPSPTRTNPDGARDSRFHITLIRRDPAHGSQWNVGTISGSDADRSAIDIEISTPGYGRFVNNDDTLSLASLGLNLPSISRNGPPSQTLSTPASKAENAPSATDVGPKKFCRKVQAVSHSHSHRHDDSRQFADLTNSGVAESHIKFTPSRMKSGYYTFTSPWNGTCSFVASVNGRSLKCKHTIPGPSASTENPAVTVAEIRFNVPFPLGHHPHSQHQHQPPSRPTFSTSVNDKTKRGSLAQILTSNIQRVRHSRPGSRSGPESPSVSSSFHVRTNSNASSDQDENTPTDEDKFDLSLAREHAGGGLRGKSAKLGKLIVEDEGIKMLDLMVAACMGVWWRSYYQP
ncbi:hypothetical protein VTN77DRAFT_8837 [Rasamsonia byssochlamydoides]|uniref:uncharacterized protein n=1 Tax=Rasamsonia byssochlamydoides TaxID=89139 RepID=UPI00374376B3